MQRLVEERREQIIQWRRHFHQHPELSFEEFDTADYIANLLVEMGYEVKQKIGGTGVLGILDTKRPGPVLAFRADMDALPILEETGLSYESVRPGVMHGCGHDAHMAVLLGAASVFAHIKDQLCGVIKIIFQPGEEANGGAKCMMNDGVLKNPDVDGIFALHVVPELPVGTVGMRAGHLTATDDEFTIRIHGESAHSSEPQEGVNAIVIGAQIINGLQTIQSTNLSPFDVATFSICKIKGGEAVNVIPDFVEMQGMLRCVKKESKLLMRKRIETIAKNTAKAYLGEAEVDFLEGFPSVNNDEKWTQEVIQAAQKALEEPEDVLQIKQPHLGSEDFAYYQEEVPGVMMMLGCKRKEGETGTLHSSNFDLDENALLYGAKVFVELAWEKMKMG